MAIMGVTSADLQRQHDDYTNNKDNWELFRDAYEGTGGFADGTHLVQFPREPADRFTDRKELAYYVNFCKAVIDVYIGHLLKRPAIRQHNNPDLERFYVAATQNREQDIDEVVKDAARKANIFGHSFFMVDKPSVVADTKQDEIDQNAYPYTYVLTPLDILDWDVDGNGEFNWIKIKETHVIADDPLGDKDCQYWYRIWTRTGWQLWIDYADNKTSPSLLVEGKHELGRVPIVTLKNKARSDNAVLGVSEINDIAYMNKAHYNRNSEETQTLRDQGYAILIYPGDVTPTVNADGTTYSVKTGTDRMITYNPEGGGKPEFIAPPSSVLEAYKTKLEEIAKSIFETARLDYGEGVRLSPSGVALAFRFEKTNQALLDKANNLQRAEEKIAALVQLWQRPAGSTAELDEVSIVYPTNFALEDNTVALKNDLDTLDMDISPTFNKEYKKEVVRRRMKELPQETLDTIDNEIDNPEPQIDIDAAIEEEKPAQPEITPEINRGSFVAN
jgi:hypothetical protein